MIELGPHRYGKERIRLVKVIRGPDRHTVRDLTVAVALEGDFAAAHTQADNSGVIATDTMKNTVYALAKERLDGPPERFGLALAAHFLDAGPQVARATITLAEHAWRPIELGGGPAPDAFSRGAELTRTARVTAERSGATIAEAGVESLSVMKTARSAFAGFPRDRYTTLPETDDRILATQVAATWRYAPAAVSGAGFDFDGAFDRARRALLTAFADHDSASVQQTIWVMGRAMLTADPAIEEIHFSLPNLHHWLVDLAPFGLANDREVFMATDQPYGLIEATVRRAAAVPS